MSLRTRLVLGVLALAAIGLVVADIATYSSLRSFLFQRTDSALQTNHTAVEGPAGEALASGDCDVLRDSRQVGFIQVRRVNGQIVCTQRIIDFSKAAPGGGPPPANAFLPSPRLPASLALPERPAEGPDRVRYFTAPATRGGMQYRVRAAIESDGKLVLIIATPLDDVIATLHRLLLIELLVTAAVLAAIVLVGLWIVRLGMRPLAGIERTAAAIASGDLSQRIERAEPETEVGRLGLALNTMLQQIEAAFRAREASEARLRRFVADASHELRTPLAAVRAYAELFRRGADRRPDDLARAMSGIEREGERMSVLVEDLLLLARLDEGRPLERKAVDLDQLAGEAVETARTVEPERPIALVVEPAVVLGDRERLRQVLDNLLSNIRMHTPPGTPARVSVSRSNGSAVLEVADDGPGMSAEAAERAFERFYRADATRSRSSGGVGLGLSIVAAVAEAHAGAASASSEPGKGTSFLITLPLVDGDGSPSSV